MASLASDIYRKHPGYYDEETRRLLETGETPLDYPRAVVADTARRSRAIATSPRPMIIVASSGMLTGGRILHHLVSFGPDRRNAILLAGYQAGGTRGASLANGADHLRIFGRDIAINAEVIQLSSFSGHADAGEIIDWMRPAGRAPRMTWLTHGEPDGADMLRKRIRNELGWTARVPEHLETVDMDHPR